MDTDFRVIGCRGPSVFQILPYYKCAYSSLEHFEAARQSSVAAKKLMVCRFPLFWHLETAHALLYGVVKGFWTLFFGSLPNRRVTG